ncbi:MAG: ComF family protein [Clostridia bacterium]|nr:ComF family protein [Clostridia bacterium]
MTVRERLLAVFLPKRCVFCDTVIAPVRVCCQACEAHLSVVAPPVCMYCGQAKRQCGCAKHRLAFDKIAAPFYYEAAVRDGILRLKRRDDPDAIRYFAERMREVVRREYGDEPIDGLTYVPMTARALREREYNQGKLLAEALGTQLMLPVYATLKKIYETPPQKELDLHARSGNVLGVFEVTDRTVRGKTLLLVDDVITTGATLHECAKMLKIYGAGRVLAVTVAVRRHKS